MIVLKSDKEIEVMRKSCRLSSEILDMIQSHIRPGITTLELNDICEDYTLSHGAISAPLNYKGFPKSICTSINEVICHGIPSAKQKLKEGDIINVDITTIIDGYHGDTSRTFYVGTKISPMAKKLTECAKKCLNLGIEQVKLGGHVGDIGFAVQSYAEEAGFSVVREFVGHGIGKKFHEDPQIPHYGKAGTGTKLQKGMTLTIEPMINEGTWNMKVLKDGWTAITADGKLSAQWEHTIAIRSDGTVDVLTRFC